MQLTMLMSCILLVHRTVWGGHFSFGRDPDHSSGSGSVEKAFDNETEANTPTFPHENDSTLPSGNQSLSSSSSAPGIHSEETLPSGNQSLSPSSSAPGIHSEETSTALFTNESRSRPSSNESTATTDESGIQSTILATSTNNETNATSSTTEDDEPEGVARGKPSTTESGSITTKQPQTVFEKTWALISDTYTLSILVPVAAGVVFATTVILTIATCRCLRRRCIRRRLRRKTLPDSVKNLRPSDRARLLAESSDEEF